MALVIRSDRQTIGNRINRLRLERGMTMEELAAKAGVQPAIISGIMRHTSYAQTMDYTHVGREEKLKAITSTLHPV